MKEKIYLICGLFLLLLLAGCNSLGVAMPASVCQATCTDDVTGETYGIAFRSIVFINNGELDDYVGSDNGCYMYLYAYKGRINEDGDFEDGALGYKTKKGEEIFGYKTKKGEEIFGFDPDDPERFTLSFFDDNLPDAITDYLYTNDDDPERFTLSFFDDNLPDAITDYLYTNDILFKLLYESTTTVQKEGNSIYTRYYHDINPCVLNSKIIINSKCEDGSPGQAYISCEITDEDEVETQKVATENSGGEFDCAESGKCVHDINYEDIDSDIQYLIEHQDDLT